MSERPRLYPYRPLAALAVAAGLSAALPAVAQDAASAQGITEYLGGGYLTFSDSCAQYGWTGIHQVMARAQPQGHPGNPENETQLALFFGTGTIAMRYDQEYSRRYATVTTATYVWNGPWTPEEPIMAIAYDAYYGDWLMDEQDDLISVNIHLSNFNELRGCSAEMRLAFGRN
ncbi:MAG: hypothetical protein H6898_06980 [Rhodobacter sp.]|nr:hypothetical protein [Paracoccaceae bacterium]MCC0076318.1 hypothetical protein [Rhodobacter sp.]